MATFIICIHKFLCSVYCPFAYTRLIALKRFLQYLFCPFISNFILIPAFADNEKIKLELYIYSYKCMSASMRSEVLPPEIFPYDHFVYDIRLNHIILVINTRGWICFSLFIKSLFSQLLQAKDMGLNSK